MTPSAGQTTRVAFDGEVIELSGEELDQVLQALAGLGLREAESVAEQIAALRLAGGTIDLVPTEAEVAALGLALRALGTRREHGGTLARLAAICGAGAPALGVRVGAA